MIEKERDALLFLDLDGVANSQKFFEALAERRARQEPVESRPFSEEERMTSMLDPEAIERLNEVVMRCHTHGVRVEIVISSSWRLVYSIGSIRRALRAQGFRYAQNIIDRTPYSAEGDHTSRRGNEIRMWLQQNRAAGHPWTMAIVDDSADMAEFLPRLVRTDNYRGLQDEHIQKLVDMLAGE